MNDHGLSAQLPYLRFESRNRIIQPYGTSPKFTTCDSLRVDLRDRVQRDLARMQPLIYALPGPSPVLTLMTITHNWPVPEAPPQILRGMITSLAFLQPMVDLALTKRSTIMQDQIDRHSLALRCGLI